MSPRKQPTAAKRARAAARRGEKFTTALRSPATTEVVDPDMIVAGLTELARDGGPMPVEVAAPENPQPRPDYAEDRIWGVVDAAVDGYVVRPLSWGEPLGTGREQRRTRVPVPYRTDGGQIQVAQLPPLAWSSRASNGRWIYAHTGWAVEEPGRIADRASSLAPSFELPYEVTAFHHTGRTPEEVYGEDYEGSPSWWGLSSWCAAEADARELADALIDYDCRTLRVQVWEHDRADLGVPPGLRYQRDAAPDRPPLPRLPWGTAVPGRPDAPDTGLTAEPAWNNADSDRPKYALHVWTGQGWRTHSWHGGRQWAGIAADRLRIGVDGGRYAFGYVSAPHYPRAWDHDWTQDGRSCSDLVPDPSTTEQFDREHMARVLG